MNAMLKKCLLLGAVITSIAAAADAHPRLMNANPAPGAVLKASPNTIRMTFSEGLVQRFTGLALTTSKGAAIATGPTSVSGADNTELSVPLRAGLKPGTYNLAWHAVSVDTHRVKGSYTFRIVR
jgi:methionine-rich copper-binding protein CopC